jgi:thiol-disulfide isomerase/thioredoxin
MGIKTLTSKDFDPNGNLLIKTPCVIMFKANWCGHCQHAKPIFEKASLSSSCNNICKMYFVEEEESKALLKLLEKLKLKNTKGEVLTVDGFPTFVKFENGKYKSTLKRKSKELILDLAPFICS